MRTFTWGSLHPGDAPMLANSSGIEVDFDALSVTPHCRDRTRPAPKLRSYTVTHSEGAGSIDDSSSTGHSSVGKEEGHGHKVAAVSVIALAYAAAFRAARRRGRASLALIRRLTSQREDSGVRAGLISMTGFSAWAAMRGSVAAGWTTADVPTVRYTSQCSAAATLRSQGMWGSISPNHTMSGRMGAPQ